MTIGQKIRLYREFRGYNQLQLAEASGINVGSIRKYELGLRNPKPDQLKRIANGLMLSESIFYEFDISTAGDVASLLFILDDAIDIEFCGEDAAGKYDEKTVCLKFKDTFLKKFMAKWANEKKELGEVKKVFNEEVPNDEIRESLIKRYEDAYTVFKMSSIDSPYIVKKGTEGISVKNYTPPNEE
jgi:transcriptional regulator with XRE-family HTH domain